MGKDMIKALMGFLLVEFLALKLVINPVLMFACLLNEPAALVI
jgi:hypothetical protein